MKLTNLTSKQIATHLKASAIDNFKITGNVSVPLLNELSKLYPDHTLHIVGNSISVLDNTNVTDVLFGNIEGIKTYEI